MIDFRDYNTYLLGNGRTLGEYRKNQADLIQNVNFQGDIGFRKVYILDPLKGWHYEDAKFSRHANMSLSNDDADSYLQFRPKVHYPIGTYVFIPPEKTYDLDINYKDPLNENCENLWLITKRTDSRQFTRYLVLPCDWLLKWVVDLGNKKKIEQCWGIAKAANSYTSWKAQYYLCFYSSLQLETLQLYLLNCWEVLLG